MSTTQAHLTSQYYDICIRRTRSYCSICYSPQILSTTTGTASSYGLGASGTGPAQQSAVSSLCSGTTTLTPTATAGVGYGDYLDIVALQAPPSSSGALNTNRICGVYWAAAPAATAHATACSWAVPFKVGVHFDADDMIGASADVASPNFDHFENDDSMSTGAGIGYMGFYLAYWQNAC